MNEARSRQRLWCSRERPGGCCLMICRPGRRSTSRATGGWMRVLQGHGPRSALHHPRGTGAPGAAQRRGDGRANVAIELREWPTRGLRRLQTQARQQYAHGEATLGHLLAVHVTPADEQERAQVHKLCEDVQQATGHSVQRAWADQGYTGEAASKAAQDNGIDLQIVKLPEAKKGFVLLPRRWVVERSFGWLARFRRISRDYERLPEVLGGLHFLVFAVLMLPAAARVLAAAGSS